MSRPARSLPPEIPSTENPPGSRIDSENASCPASPPISSSSKFAGRGEDPGEDWDPPNVSVLVPVKNEEKVVGRLLDALVRLDYPKENLEVVVVEDESRIGRWISARAIPRSIRGSKCSIAMQASGKVML